MALAAKMVSNAEGEVTPAATSKVFDRIHCMQDTKFKTLTSESSFTDDGFAVANENEGSATTVPQGWFMEGRWTAIELHSGLIRVYEAF